MSRMIKFSDTLQGAQYISLDHIVSYEIKTKIDEPYIRINMAKGQEEHDHPFRISFDSVKKVKSAQKLLNKLINGEESLEGESFKEAADGIH